MSWTPTHSDGPFSRVYFMLTRGVLTTYTNRYHRLQPTGTQIHVITTIDDTRLFRDIFVETSLLEKT